MPENINQSRNNSKQLTLFSTDVKQGDNKVCIPNGYLGNADGCHPLPHGQLIVSTEVPNIFS